MIFVDSVEQNNVTNNLLDLSIDGMNPLAQPITEQILAHTTVNTSSNGKLVNEDSVNFNTAPSTNPFIAFQDNKKQDTVNGKLLACSIYFKTSRPTRHFWIWTNKNGFKVFQVTWNCLWKRCLHLFKKAF